MIALYVVYCCTVVLLDIGYWTGLIFDIFCSLRSLPFYDEMAFQNMEYHTTVPTLCGGSTLTVSIVTSNSIGYCTHTIDVLPRSIQCRVQYDTCLRTGIRFCFIDRKYIYRHAVSGIRNNCFCI